MYKREGEKFGIAALVIRSSLGVFETTKDKKAPKEQLETRYRVSALQAITRGMMVVMMLRVGGG